MTPSLEVLVSSAVLSIDKEEYYVDSFNVIETEEFAIEEYEFVLDTFSITYCSPSKQPRLMNTKSRQVTVDCPLETSFPPITLSITDHEASDTAVQVKASSLDSQLHVSQLGIDFQQELTTHPNLAPNQLAGQELTAHYLTDAFGPDWYDHCDSVVKNLHELLTSGELPREHICYKFLKDVIGYIDCMTKQDRRQQVCWS